MFSVPQPDFLTVNRIVMDLHAGEMRQSHKLKMFMTKRSSSMRLRQNRDGPEQRHYLQPNFC